MSVAMAYCQLVEGAKLSREKIGPLHATPQSPNPELSSTEPLLMSTTASSALAQTFEPLLLRSSKGVADLRVPVVAQRRYPPLKEETGTNFVPKDAPLKAKQAPEVRAWSKHFVAVASIGAVCRTVLAILVISTLNSLCM